MKLVVLLLTLVVVAVVHAADRAVTAPVTQSSNDASAMTSGEVRKIDKAQGKITIRHEPLTNLQMPAMTMVFRVKDPAMLDQVKEGDKIKFVADRVNGAFIVVKWEAAK